MRKEAEKPLFLSLNLNFLRIMNIQKPKLRLRKVLEEALLSGKTLPKIPSTKQLIFYPAYASFVWFYLRDVFAWKSR